jgi:hypothetical protein
MSGCAICVYDLYNESLEEYDSAMSNLRAALMAEGVREEEWPERVRESVGGGGGGDEMGASEGKQGDGKPKKSERRANPVMSAFEAMERELEDRRRKLEKESESRSDSDVKAGVTSA